MIPFNTLSDMCILNQYVEAGHDWVGFDENITCDNGDIPIFVLFVQEGLLEHLPNV